MDVPISYSCLLFIRLCTVHSNADLVVYIDTCDVLVMLNEVGIKLELTKLELTRFEFSNFELYVQIQNCNLRHSFPTCAKCTICLGKRSCRVKCQWLRCTRSVCRPELKRISPVIWSSRCLHFHLVPRHYYVHGCESWWGHLTGSNGAHADRCCLQYQCYVTNADHKFNFGLVSWAHISARMLLEAHYLLSVQW